MSPPLPLALARDSRSVPLVIALHCSGGTGRQWRALTTFLNDAITVLAPDLIGTPDRGQWCGSGPFSLAEEAASILGLIDSCTGPVHLVGHSYGGGLALHIATQRPSRISSLSLYEPSAFHLLPTMGPEGRVALREIQGVARAAEEGLLSGSYSAAAERFVDYWNGAGAWTSLKPHVQADVVRYLPKVCLDFRAMFTSLVRLEAVRHLNAPTLLLRGERAPRPTAMVTRQLHAAAKRSTLQVVSGADHMGPLTHAPEVAALMGHHILTSSGTTLSHRQAA